MEWQAFDGFNIFIAVAIGITTICVGIVIYAVFRGKNEE
jgi:hypothetical protein